MGHDVLEGVFVGHSLGTSEMRHDDEGAASGKHLLEGGDSRTDTGVVRNLELVVEGDVEVYADDGFLAREIVSVYVLLHNDIEYNCLSERQS